MYIDEVMAVVLNDSNFEAEVLQAELPVLVDFWAPWCGPCLIMGPVIEELAEKFEGRVKFGKLNVDEGSGTARRYGVMSIPTLMIFKGGEVVEQLVGVQPRGVLAGKLDQLIGDRV